MAYLIYKSDPQEHGNCKKTQDFSCVKIDYDQVGRFSLKLIYGPSVRSNDDAFESQDFFSDEQSHISATLLLIWFSLPR